MKDQHHTSRIQQLLKISEDQYNNLVIDSGMTYLGQQRAWTKRGLEKLKQSRSFWHWWWRNWLAVDAAMLGNDLCKLAVEEYLRAHLQAHAFEMPRTMWRHYGIDQECRMTKHKLPPKKERLR